MWSYVAAWTFHSQHNTIHQCFPTDPCSTLTSHISNDTILDISCTIPFWSHLQLSSGSQHLHNKLSKQFLLLFCLSPVVFLKQEKAPRFPFWSTVLSVFGLLCMTKWLTDLTLVGKFCCTYCNILPMSFGWPKSLLTSIYATSSSQSYPCANSMFWIYFGRWWLVAVLINRLTGDSSSSIVTLSALSDRWVGTLPFPSLSLSYHK